MELFGYGRAPYCGVPKDAIEGKILAGELPEMPPDMPEQIEELVQDCCRLEPQEREHIGAICSRIEAILACNE